MTNLEDLIKTTDWLSSVEKDLWLQRLKTPDSNKNKEYLRQLADILIEESEWIEKANSRYNQTMNSLKYVQARMYEMDHKILLADMN